MADTRWLQGRREAAWAHGRKLRDHLLHQHQQRYNLELPPPPAIVIRELLTEELCARLHFDPLGQDRYAEVRLVDGKAVVTVNSEIEGMPDVKDAAGVENVAMWHETLHIDSHLDALRSPASRPLPGFDEPAAIVCYRAPSQPHVRNDVVEREFWAEEAGRAAAVSLPALRRTEPFQELLRLARSTRGHVRAGFPLLYDAAGAIGVNISALVRQLTLEQYIVVEDRLVYVQSTLLDGAS